MRHPHITSLKKFGTRIGIVPNFARRVREEFNQASGHTSPPTYGARDKSLNTVMTGASITQVRDDIYLVDVVVRATDEQRLSLATLSTLQVPLPGG